MGRLSPRLRTLATELVRRYPHLEDADALIVAGEVLVNGFPRTNPASLLGTGDSIRVNSSKPLRGTAKLAHGLRVFDVRARGRVAVDLGAAAGGFTQALLDAGVTRVYAVDVGHGQLRGCLRQHPRVINLERRNLADLDTRDVPEPVGLISIDLSYLSVASAVSQLTRLRIEPAADLIALVKPAYELNLPKPPTAEVVLGAAVAHAAEGLTKSGWSVLSRERSPVRGSRGAVEYLVHARATAGRETRRGHRCTTPRGGW